MTAMSRLMLQYLAAIAAFGISAWVLGGLRGWYWNHALFVSLAIGALVFTTWRTVERMRR